MSHVVGQLGSRKKLFPPGSVGGPYKDPTIFLSVREKVAFAQDLQRW